MLKTEPSPARSGSVLHPPGGRRPGLASICTATTSPISPDMITCRASRNACCHRVWKLMPNVTPASRQASTARLAAGAGVAGIGGGDEDHVHVREGQHPLVVGARPATAVAVGEGAGAVGIAAHHGHELAIGVLADRRGQRVVGDSARTYDPPPKSHARPPVGCFVNSGSLAGGSFSFWRPSRCLQVDARSFRARSSVFPWGPRTLG